MVAMQPLVTKTASKAWAEAASTPMATSGPANAPALSIARCTPKARPSPSSGVERVISASRGAVRRPLPARSATIAAPIPVSEPPANRRPALATAEMP